MRFKIFIAGFLNFLWNDFVTHIPLRFLRKTFLRMFNRNISASSVILLHVRILNFWSLIIKERVVINQYAVLDCRRYPITIGHDTDIGPYTRIWTLGHAPDSESHEVEGGPVSISHHVWIASGVTILPNVTLGEGAVVASGSVVSKSIPSKEIWAGVPAKFVRKRNNALVYSLNYNPYFE